MTQQELLDMIYRPFPEIGDTEVRRRLNNAVEEFAEQTKIFHKDVNITTTADNTEYSIDSSIIQVDAVLDGTTVLTELHKRPEEYTGDGTEKVYFIEGSTIHIGKLSDYTLAALDTGTAIVLKTRAKPGSFGNWVALVDSAGDPVYDSNGDPIYVVSESLTQGPDLPSQFHPAVVYRVLMDLYLDTDKRIEGMTVRDRLMLSDRYARKWRDLLVQAVAFSDRGRSGSGFTVTPWFY